LQRIPNFQLLKIWDVLYHIASYRDLQVAENYNHDKTASFFTDKFNIRDLKVALLKRKIMKNLLNYASLLLIMQILSCSPPLIMVTNSRQWNLLQTKNACEKRHECALVELKGDLYLIGGRGIKPVEKFDPLDSELWEKMAPTPIEMHHFQAITFENEIYIIGAFTGGYPHETPISAIWIFNPKKNEWRNGGEIPTDRQRGGAGAFVRNKKIYLVNGITDGHWAGHVSWFDVYDPKTKKWEKLPDSPHARDHFQTAVVGDKLYIAGGRRSSAKTDEVLQLTVGEVDVFDFKTKTWATLPESLNIPTKRAGCTAIAFNERVLIIGGESISQEMAHNECEAFNTKTQRWETLQPLKTGRHGTQAALIWSRIYIVAGCGSRGGTPEQNSIEVF
jgi:hypothetical protein